MRSLSLSTIIFCNFILTFNGLTKAAIVRRFNYDARLYEHFAFDSRYIQYSRTDPAAWASLSALTESRNFTFQSMLCTFGPGAWLLYPEANYDMGNRQIYYLVIGEHCVRSDDIYSIQPLGKMDEILEQAVMLFTKPNFGSAPTVVEGDGSGEAQSLIFTGDESFTLSGGSAKYCISPEHSAGYCVIPNLKALKIEGSATISVNCTDETLADPDGKIIVHNCYGDGVHELYTDQDLSADKIKEVCTGGGSQFDKSKFAIVMEMWGKRLGKDYVGPHGQGQDTEESIKLSIMWNIVDTFDAICGPIDTIYSYILGSLFEIHLQNAWRKGAKEGGGGGGDAAKESEKASGNDTDSQLSDWVMVLKWTDYCKAHLTSEIGVVSDDCKKNRDDGDISDATFGDEWYSIVNGHEFDPVIEQMWLIINAFIPACSNAQSYGTNDWNDMILTFNENFLTPLKDIWSDPQDWTRVYTAAFHGYDMREEHQDVLNCLKGVLISTPAFDPIGRPKGFRDHLTYSYLIPTFGEIEKKKGGAAGKKEKKKEKEAAAS